MKKILALVLAIVMLISFAGCGSSGENETPEVYEPAIEEPEIEEPQYVTETDNFKLDGMAVDNSYRDEDNSPIRLVYLFYTVTATDTNLKVSSVYNDLTINGLNTYESKLDVGGDFIRGYHYDDTILDIYIGESKKVVSVFRIPEGDLAPGREVTFYDDDIPGVENIKFLTDEIRYFESDEELAKGMDPEGYAEEMDLRNPADAETVAKVEAQLVGYTYSEYTQYVTYKISFYKNGKCTFANEIGGLSNSLDTTFEVLKGYIGIINFEGEMSYIPYEFEEDGSIDLDINEGFLG